MQYVVCYNVCFIFLHGGKLSQQELAIINIVTLLILPTAPLTSIMVNGSELGMKNSSLLLAGSYCACLR